MREIFNGKVISNGTNVMDYGAGDEMSSYISVKVTNNLDDPEDYTTSVIYGIRLADRSDLVGKPARIILEVDE